MNAGSEKAEKSVEVGTGVEHFEPILEGQSIALDRGLQGGSRHFGFHVWFGARLAGVEREDLHLRFVVRSRETGEALGENEYRWRLEPGDSTLEGLRVLLSDCCAAEERPLRMEVEVVDGAGWVGSDARDVVAKTCARGPPDPSIDPCP